MIAAEALRLHPADTVAVALRDIAAGARIRWQGGGHAGAIAVRDAVPLGHKISLSATLKGGFVMKYGAAIGRATRDIPAGAHVHVHNLASARAQSLP